MTTTIISAHEKMESLSCKTESWKTCIEKCQTFPILIDYLNELVNRISGVSFRRVRGLQFTLIECVSPTVGFQWLRNPFMFRLAEQG